MIMEDKNLLMNVRGMFVAFSAAMAAVTYQLCRLSGTIYPAFVGVAAFVVFLAIMRNGRWKSAEPYLLSGLGACAAFQAFSFIFLSVGGIVTVGSQYMIFRAQILNFLSVASLSISFVLAVYGSRVGETRLLRLGAPTFAFLGLVLVIFGLWI
jgi:hypothetical protein